MSETTEQRDAVRQAVGCPTCLVPVGAPCTRPTSTSREPVRWLHAARWDAYATTKETA